MRETIKQGKKKDEINYNGIVKKESWTLGQGFDEASDETSTNNSKSLIKLETEDNVLLVDDRSSKENKTDKKSNANYSTDDETSHSQVSSTNHSVDHLKDLRPFPCPSCPKTYKTANNLNRHLSSHTGDTMYECSYCPKTFLRSDNRDDHEKTHRGDCQFDCPKCDKKFVLKKHLTEHNQRTHPESTPYACPYPNCQISFARPNFVTHHVQVCHGVKEHKCPTCQLEFTLLSTLKRHFKSKRHLMLSNLQNKSNENVSLNKRKVFQCGLCPKSYKTEDRLKNHKESRGHGSNDDVISNRVERCDLPAVSHLDNGEDSISINYFECNLCLKSFKSRKRLQGHQKKENHNEKSPHECPVCLENFETIHLLESHFVQHGPNTFL